MSASPLADRLPAQDLPPWHRPFLTSSRATTVCKRELEALTDELARRLAALHAAGTVEAPDVRLSPDRFLVQLGPVALTIVWLRGAGDVVSEGELMVIVWRGIAGRRAPLDLERPGARRPASATALWEEVLAAAAEDEATWSWRPRSDRAASWTSVELAGRCVERLRVAYLEAAAAAER